MASNKKRLDVLLVERGLVESRQRAQAERMPHVFRVTACAAPCPFAPPGKESSCLRLPMQALHLYIACREPGPVNANFTNNFNKQEKNKPCTLYVSLAAGPPHFPDASPEKAHWGRDKGIGGKGTTLPCWRRSNGRPGGPCPLGTKKPYGYRQRSEGFPFPQTRSE